MNPRRAAALVCAAVFALCVAPAIAQDSARPLRLIVPNAAGSSIDTLARLLQQALGEALGRAIVIDNRAGASGALGMEAGKNAPPDGNTLILASASNVVTATVIQKNITYDALSDFTFVARFAALPNVLVVPPQLPVKSVRELIDYVKANPGKINMASAGPGSASHLAGELLQSLGGFSAVHVPYKGGSPAAASVIAGETQFYLTPAPNAMALVKAGRLRALGHSQPGKSPLLPDLPAIAETVAGYDTSGWAGIIGPKGLPDASVQQVRAALATALARPALRDAFAAQGAEIVSSTPQEFRAFVERDLATTARIARAAGIKSE